LLKRVRDYAQVVENGIITEEIAKRGLMVLEVDKLGLDAVDRKLVLTLIENFKGGPVGVDTLAAATGEERGTIEDVYEPYLLQMGFLSRTPRGRMVTEKAYRHFNIPLPAEK
jgi:Holliday junction DNA helicase RuvB